MVKWERSMNWMRISSSIKSKSTSRNSCMKCVCNPRSKRSNSTNSDIESLKEKCRLTFKSRKVNSHRFKSKYTSSLSQRSRLKPIKRLFWGKFKKCKALLNKSSSTMRSKEINWINFSKATNCYKNKCNSVRVRWLRSFSPSSNLLRLIGNWKHN